MDTTIFCTISLIKDSKIFCKKKTPAYIESKNPYFEEREKMGIGTKLCFCPGVDGC